MPSIQVLDAVGATQTVQTLPAVGQAAMAASLPMVIASDQPSIPSYGPDIQINGSITNSCLFVPGAATASDAQGLEIRSGDIGQQFITLRGVAENIAVNFNGVTLAGGAVNINIEWTES